MLWRSLHNAPALEDILLDWLSVLAQQADTQLSQGIDHRLALLIECLQERRCLLVLDNLETLFQGGVLEGRYREGYEGYATLIRYVAETAHQSCLVLTCRERFPELEALSGRQPPVRVLRLAGLALLAGRQLLADKELFGADESWGELVQRYAGNPWPSRSSARPCANSSVATSPPFWQRASRRFMGSASS